MCSSALRSSIVSDDDFKVSVDDQVRYLLRRIGELSGIDSSGAVDFELAKKLGHQIKGNADTFEFPNLTATAKELEVKAVSQDGDGVKTVARMLLNSMREHLKQLAP
jgi:HPt (histidine-containing phosphotransfer) domain-containing protein